jgi:hypothetical protein
MANSKFTLPKPFVIYFDYHEWGRISGKDNIFSRVNSRPGGRRTSQHCKGSHRERVKRAPRG